MSETNDWYEGIEREVTSLRDKMSRSDKYLYKLDLLLETAKKVAELSSECKECQGYQNQITNLIAVVKNLPTLDEKGEIPNYSKPFENIIKHLKKYHGVVLSRSSWLLPIGSFMILAGIGCVSFYYLIGDTRSIDLDALLPVILASILIVSGLGILVIGIVRR